MCSFRDGLRQRSRAKEVLDHRAVAVLDKPFCDENLLDAMRLALVQ
jgi:hypothetical protein